MSVQSEKRARLAQANRLVEIISDHGRRFFFDKASGRVGRFEMDLRGRIWWRDEYQGDRLYCHPTPFERTPLSTWRFGHGGTLRALLMKLVRFIETGETVGRGWISASDRQSRTWDLCPDAGWVRVPSAVFYGWGYDDAGAQAVRDAAFVLPVVDGWQDEIARNETYAWQYAPEMAAAA